MNVAELICKELGVKVGERFKYYDVEYAFIGGCLSGELCHFSLAGDLVEDMLKNKDKIVKINKLFDSLHYKNLLRRKYDLFLDLQRFADEHNGRFTSDFMYPIWYNTKFCKWEVGLSITKRDLLSVHFSGEEVANKALEVFKDDLEGIRLEEQRLRGEI